MESLTTEVTVLSSEQNKPEKNELPNRSLQKPLDNSPNTSLPQDIKEISKLSAKIGRLSMQLEELSIERNEYKQNFNDVQEQLDKE